MQHGSHLLQAPARYEFKYGVKDGHTHDTKKVADKREGDKVTGYYSPLEADNIRIIHYSTDNHNEFQARVSRSGYSPQSTDLVKVLIAPVTCSTPTASKLASPVTSSAPSASQLASQSLSLLLQILSSRASRGVQVVCLEILLFGFSIVISTGSISCW
jgi:hypothetical protein